jgi:hypothetical protein
LKLGITTLVAIAATTSVVSCVTAKRQGGATRVSIVAAYTAREQSLVGPVAVSMTLRGFDNHGPIAEVSATIANHGAETFEAETTDCSITVRAKRHDQFDAVQVTPDPGCHLILRHIRLAPGGATTVRQPLNLSHPDITPGDYDITGTLTLSRPFAVSAPVNLVRVQVAQ